MGDTDEQQAWIAQSRKGDQNAFAELVRLHQQMIHALTFRMTGSVADCQDLAQETFIRAYQQLDSYHGGAKFSTWLYRIAVNACIDWQRREARRGKLHDSWGEEQPKDYVETAFGAPHDEASREVQAALMKLPEKQRAAIVLTVYSEHSHAEAAKILNCTEATISWRIFSARRRLKKLLTRKGVPHE